MASQSIAGLNVKIGANTKELQDELGKVTGIIKDDLEPGTETTQKLSQNFADSAKNALLTAISAGGLAISLGKIGKTLGGFVKGALEDALKLHPDTAQTVETMKTSFDNIKVALGESLIPLINEWGPKVISWLDGVAQWIKENPETSTKIMELAGSAAILATTLGTAIPIVIGFQMAFGALASPILAAAAALAGFIALVALLGDQGTGDSNTISQYWDMDEEEQLRMDAAREVLMNKGYNYQMGSVMDADGNWLPEETLARWDEFENRWVTQNEDLEKAMAELPQTVTESLAEVDAATESLSESTETGMSTADQANEILQNMQQTVGDFATTTEVDLQPSMDAMNQLLESEAFRQFAKEPVSEEVATSWTTFGTAVDSASGGFESLNTTLGDGTISGYISGTGDAAKGAAEGFSALAEAINAVVGAYNDLARTNPTGGGTPAGGGSSAANNQTDVFRAGGGPVLANHPYIVGEFRPEIFIPGEDGMIVPTAGGITVNVGNVYGESYLRDYVTRTVTGAIRQGVRLGA